MKEEFVAKHLNHPPYRQLALVYPDPASKEQSYLELRVGPSGIMLAPKRLTPMEAAEELLAFFVKKAEHKTLI